MGCPVYPGQEVDAGPDCCDLSCRLPEADDDLPTAQSYVLEYAWACDCGEVNGTEDIDAAGSEQVCGGCGQRTRITT